MCALRTCGVTSAVMLASGTSINAAVAATRYVSNSSHRPAKMKGAGRSALHSARLFRGYRVQGLVGGVVACGNDSLGE